MSFEMAAADPGGRVKNRREAEYLEAHPNEWFTVTTCETLDAAWSFAHQISIGRRAAFRPKGKFEGRSSGLDVLGRYLPD